MNFTSTMPRSCLLLVCMILVMVATPTVSVQDTNHRKPRDPPLGSLSLYNKDTKMYQPVSAINRWELSFFTSSGVSIGCT